MPARHELEDNFYTVWVRFTSRQFYWQILSHIHSGVYLPSKLLNLATRYLAFFPLLSSEVSVSFRVRLRPGAVSLPIYTSIPLRFESHALWSVS